MQVKSKITGPERVLRALDAAGKSVKALCMLLQPKPSVGVTSRVLGGLGQRIQGLPGNGNC